MSGVDLNGAERNLRTWNPRDEQIETRTEPNRTENLWKGMGGQAMGWLVSISAYFERPQKQMANNVIMFDSLSRLDSLSSLSVVGCRLSAVVLLTDIYDIIRRKIMLLQPHRIWFGISVSPAMSQTVFVLLWFHLPLQAAKICLIVRKTKSQPLFWASPKVKYLSKSN